MCRAGCQACAEVLLSLGKAMEAEVETFFPFLFLLTFSVETFLIFFGGDILFLLVFSTAGALVVIKV